MEVLLNTTYETEVHGDEISVAQLNTNIIALTQAIEKLIAVSERRLAGRGKPEYRDRNDSDVRERKRRNRERAGERWRDCGERDRHEGDRHRFQRERAHDHHRNGCGEGRRRRERRDHPRIDW